MVAKKPQIETHRDRMKDKREEDDIRNDRGKKRYNDCTVVTRIVIHKTTTKSGTYVKRLKTKDLC